MVDVMSPMMLERAEREDLARASQRQAAVNPAQQRRALAGARQRKAAKRGPLNWDRILIWAVFIWAVIRVATGYDTLF